MREETSPIADLFPADFKIDLEGKRASYEAVVLLPFVDKDRIVAACDSVPRECFTAGELEANTVGEIFEFVPDVDSNETEFCNSTLPLYACDVVHSGSRCIRRQPPQALPNGQPGFQPEILEV
jgi:5'-3' exonuclease